MTPPSLIRLRAVTRQYGATAGGGEDEAGAPVRALDELSLEIGEREFAAVTGPSGCGKSTLLHLLGGLDRPTSGEMWVGDLAMHSADENALTRYRRQDLGIVFQFFNLLPTMNVLENVSLPLLLAGESPRRSRPRAMELLDLVGMTPRVGHFVQQLSGGEMQRTAIARALVHRPRLLLADEPTGNLDSQNAARVLEVLQKVAAAGLTTMVIVTHSEEVARAAGRHIRLVDGRLKDEG